MRSVSLKGGWYQHIFIITHWYCFIPFVCVHQFFLPSSTFQRIFQPDFLPAQIIPCFIYSPQFLHGILSISVRRFRWWSYQAFCLAFRTAIHQHPFACFTAAQIRFHRIPLFSLRRSRSSDHFGHWMTSFHIVWNFWAITISLLWFARMDCFVRIRYGMTVSTSRSIP